MRRLLALPERPTAVFCSDDAIASYAIRAALDCGLRVPQDVSVVGFDHQTVLPGRYRGPEITSVEQPLYDIGVDSVTLLSSILDQTRENDPVTKLYHTKLVIQETVCKPE